MIPSIAINISTPPPSPSLLSLIPGDGGTNDPATTMSLTWSAAPYGLARYRIWIGNPDRLGALTLIPLSGIGTGGGASRSARQASTAGTARPLSGTVFPLLTAVYRDFVVEGGITNLPCSVIDTTLVGGRVGIGPVGMNCLLDPHLLAHEIEALIVDIHDQHARAR